MDDLNADPGLPAPDAAPSPADLAFPLPPMAPVEMGLPAGPVRTVAPPVPVPHLNDKQTLLRLLTLGAMVGGAGHPLGAAGFAHGVVASQDQLLKDQQEAQQRQQQNQTLLDRQYEQDQRTYQSATEQRQKDLQGAVQSMRGQLGKAKTADQYDQMVEGFSNLLRARGFRGVDANWVRQVQPFIAPSKQDRAGQALDKLLANPLTQAAMKTNPQGVVNGTVQFDANDDGTPETYTIQQLSVLAGRPMVAGPDGQPVLPDAAGEQIPGDAFKAKMQSLTALFVATNRRPPTAKEKDDLVNQAREFTQEKPASSTSTAQDSLMQRSYQYTNTQIEKLRTPLDQTVTKLTDARDLLSQGTPASDALAIPKILTAVAGGQGSGVRINESELARIVGGRSQWESIKAFAQKWSLDPRKAGSLTPDQRQQLGNVLDVVQQRASAKLEKVTSAGMALVDAKDTLAHKRIYGTLQRDLSAPETPAAGGGTQIGRFQVQVEQ